MLSTVVKLFNAVYKHQKELDAKLKTAPTEAKKAKGINFFLLMKSFHCLAFNKKKGLLNSMYL